MEALKEREIYFSELKSKQSTQYESEQSLKEQRDERIAKWRSNVISDGDKLTRKGSAASSRANQEIKDSGSYLYESHDDTVEQIQDTLKRIN